MYFKKLEKCKVVMILFLEKVIRDLLKSHHFEKFDIKR